MRVVAILAAATAIAAGCGTTSVELKATRILRGHVDAQPQSAARDLHAFTARDALLFLARGRVLETRDGGRNWRAVAVRTPFGAPRFLTRLHWLASRSGRLYGTLDGGRTWRFVHELASPFHASGFVTASFAYACRSACVLSTDGGSTSRRVTLPRCVGIDMPTAAAFDDPRHGFFICGGEPSAGNQSKRAWSWDGAVWRRLPSPPEYGYVGQIEPLGANAYVHHSGRANDLITRDGGRTWHSALPPESVLRGRWVNARIGWALDPQRGDIFRTSDGGRHWAHAAPAFWPSGDTVFCTPSVGYGVGGADVNGPYGAPFLYATVDGGRHWVERGVLHGEVVACLGDELFAFRGSLQVVRSRDRGRDWHAVRLPGQAALPLALVSRNVFFVACGGRICATRDGGASFRRLQVPFGMTSFAFVSADVGFATRSIGAPKAFTTLLDRTNDGGRTWRNVPIRVPDFHPATLVAAHGTIWIFGPRCQPGRETCAPTLMRSSDRGKHWDEIRLDRFFSAQPHFDSRTLGVAGGYRGIWVTTDGGVAWRWHAAGGSAYP